MPNFVKSFIGRIAGTPDGSDPFIFNIVKKALAGFDKVEGGLSRAAATYVCTGEGSAVLLTLQQKSPKAIEHLPLQAVYRSVGGAKWSLISILANKDYWDPALILRLGQVFGAAATSLTNATWGYCGTMAGPMWLRLLLTATERGARYDGVFNSDGPQFGEFTVSRCRELLRLAEEPDDGLIDILFHRSATGYQDNHCLDALPGAEDYLRNEPEAVIAAAGILDAKGRIEMLRAIGRLGLTDTYLDYVFAQGIGSAKSTREAALPALHGAGADRLLEKAAEVFESGSPSARGHVANLIASALKEEARPLLEAHLETEKGKRVRESIETALTNLSLVGEEPAATGGEAAPGGTEKPATAENPAVVPANGGYIALDGSAVDLPPLPPMAERTKIPERLYDLLRQSMNSYNEGLAAYKKARANDKRHWIRHRQPLTERDLKRFRALLEDETPRREGTHYQDHLGEIDSKHGQFPYDRTGVEAFFAAPEVSAWHLLGLHRDHHWGLFFIFRFDHGLASLAALRDRLRDGLDFRLFAKMHAERGGKEPLRQFLTIEYMRDIDEITFDDFWVYCAGQLPLLDEALGLRPQSGPRPLIPMAALEILESFPKVPHRYLMPLMGLATGSRKMLREPARQLLAGAPQIDDAIAGLLKDGKQEVRAGAADWLAARGAKAQAPALKAVLKKERSEVARAAALTALERLGEDISAYFDPKTLLAEAEAGLKKANLKTLDWLSLDALPRVAWRGGKPLDPKVTRWWVALANKLKQPGGNALFDLYLDRLEPEDSEKLGLYLLRSWIGHDTVRASEAEANEYAQAHADRLYTATVRWVKDFTRERAFAQLKAEKLGDYLQSANANKGILGLVSHAPGVDVAEAARSYLKNHGSRTAQCKALLDCLAANPAPAAIQVVLATANRFKAKTVQAHAQALIEDIADRRGWTAEQLADRTIPTGGLDETGVLELDCGEDRVYRASLAEDGKIVLANPAGKEVKALPGARNDEEQPLIKAAKKALSGARKEIKQVDALQAGRLFEAMCLERVWTLEEWQQYLQRHPIVGRMCQRLVWLGLDSDDSIVASFRPMEDGSLTGSEDENVAVDGIAGIKLAHQTLIPETMRDAWLAHLKDYEIDPLFDQFSRPMLTPAEDQAKAVEITDRRGHMIESFKLRGAATKLGYQRGDAEDGGVFMDYVKRYEGAGIAIVLEFTGSPLPEENIACALLALKAFRLRKKSGQWGAALALKDVPPVLLSETWNDYHQIAAAGTGFDADWEKKAEFW